ncbi:MAG: glycosyltransferase [Bacteroidales bacterium]
MKRVLIITYYWPPTGGSGVQRWLKISKYLPKNGWQPVIFTPENPEQIAIDESLGKEIPKEAEIIKRHICEPYTLYHKFVGRKSSKQNLNPLIVAGKRSFKEKVSLWLRANLFVPDPRILWKKSSVKFLIKYLKENPCDVVVSTAPPQSIHLIARELKRKIDIKWIADFRDPWTKMYYFKHIPMCKFINRKHESLEKAVLNEADMVFSANKSVRDEFIEISGTDELKFYSIENGFDEDDFKVERDKSSEDKFVICQTGLFDIGRNPEKLWESLVELSVEIPEFKNDLLIRQIGKMDEAVRCQFKDLGLAKNFIDMGYMDHKDLAKYQLSSNILLLPLLHEKESQSILPGKYFEYLAARKPLVCFGPKEGALAKSLEQTKSGKIFEWNEKEILKQYVKQIYEDWIFRGKKLPEVGVENEIIKYSRRVETENICKLFT